MSLIYSFIQLLPDKSLTPVNEVTTVAERLSAVATTESATDQTSLMLRIAIKICNILVLGRCGSIYLYYRYLF